MSASIRHIGSPLGRGGIRSVSGFGSGGGAPTTVWDTVTFGSNFTFSNQDQDATKASASSGWSTVKAATGKNSGKLYFEEKIQGAADFGYVGVMGTTGTLNSTLVDNGGNDAFGKDWRGGNAIEASGGFTLQSSLLSPAITTNDIVGFSLDFTAGKLWMSLNNSWAAFKVGSDPATATSHLATFTGGTTIFPAASAYGGGGGDVIIRLAASGTYTYSPPSGYSSWG